LTDKKAILPLLLPRLKFYTQSFLPSTTISTFLLLFHPAGPGNRSYWSLKVSNGKWIKDKVWPVKESLLEGEYSVVTALFGIDGRYRAGKDTETCGMARSRDSVQTKFEF
jgi:hypothetical protein